MSDDRSEAAPPARDATTPRRGNLLFVDQDDFLIDMIRTGLSLSRPRWQIITARHPFEALDILEGHAELDAVITEIVFDRTLTAGKKFIREVGRRWPEIPIFAMTSLDPEETRGLDTADHIPKPPDIDFLVSRVDRAIRRQRESLVRGIPLPTFLQIMELEKKTCTLVVSHGGRVGELYLREGILMQARLDRLEGEEAFFAMLSLPEQRLRVVDRCDVERTIATNLTALLMEWSIRDDHARREAAATDEEDV